MSRQRCRKKDRVRIAGKKCKGAIYIWGSKKRPDKKFRSKKSK